MSGRTIAVGDIHGCSKALAAMIEAIDPQAADKLVLLGDYIDRGPDSRGVIDQLFALAKRCWLIPILGNHDKLLLGILNGKEQMFENWLALGGHTTLRSFDCAVPDLIPERYITFLANCHSAHETAGHLFVHANYVANMPLEEQPSYVLRWEALKTRCPNPHYSGKTAIVGHSAQKNGRIFDLGYVKCIDTYCYGGGWLTAIDVDSNEIWQTSQRGELRSGQLIRACSSHR